jgi:hypothetical protein
MTRGDRAVEKGSAKLRELSRKAAARGGVAEKLAGPLAEDSVFLRKLKPSLIKARARGREAGNGAVPAPTAPAGPQISGGAKRSGDGPNPLVIVGAAFAIGYVLAKVIDWRGHAHPND